MPSVHKYLGKCLEHVGCWSCVSSAWCQVDEVDTVYNVEGKTVGGCVWCGDSGDCAGVRCLHRATASQCWDNSTSFGGCSYVIRWSRITKSNEQPGTVRSNQPRHLETSSHYMDFTVGWEMPTIPPSFQKTNQNCNGCCLVTRWHCCYVNNL